MSAKRITSLWVPVDARSGTELRCYRQRPPLLTIRAGRPAIDDRVGIELHRPVQPLGLYDRNSEPEGRDLRGRRREPPAPSRGRVGPGEQERDLAARGEPFEHVGAERRGRGDREAHGYISTG